MDRTYSEHIWSIKLLMDIPINHGQIKKDVICRMRENQSLKKLNDKFRMGLTATVQDNSNEPDSESIEYFPFKTKSQNELASLQSIFRYLSEKNLQFTLSCLRDESNTNVDLNFKNILDIKTILAHKDQSSPIKKFSHHYDIDPPIIIKQKEFNSFNYILRIDEL